MIRIILIATVSVLLACSNTKEVDQSSDKVEKFDVIINATTTQAYCGAIEPAQEVLDELNTPTPAPNVKVYLRKGDKNDIEKEIDYEFLTDDSGQVKSKLPAGTYSIVFENKKDKSVYADLLEKYGKETSHQTAIDKECLKKFFAEPNAVLEVKESGENSVNVNRRKGCEWTKIPCSHFTGPMPPSAPPK